MTGDALSYQTIEVIDRCLGPCQYDADPGARYSRHSDYLPSVSCLCLKYGRQWGEVLKMASGQVSQTVLLRSGKERPWHISPVVVTISFGVESAASRLPFRIWKNHDQPVL